MKKLLLSAMALLSVACDDANTPGDAVLVQGVSAIGQLQYGTVTAYDYTRCIKGNKLATVVLQNTNNFELNIRSTTNDHPILLELSNFNYQEQWSNRTVDAIDHQLYSTAVVLPGDVEKNMIISFWTNLAAALTAQKCASNESKAVEHIEQSNDLFSTALTFDINEEKPTLITTFDSPTFDAEKLAGARYGIANAAVASYTLDFDERIGDTEAHELYNSASLAKTAFTDLRFEGFLNGVADASKIQYGDIMLSADTYRSEIPKHMTSIIRNLTRLPAGIEANALSEVAISFHDSSASGLFGFTEPTPLNDIPEPILNGITTSNCSVTQVAVSGGQFFYLQNPVYRTIATVEYDVSDAYSTYEISSISSNPVGLEYALPLVSNIVDNAIVPWRSGLKPVIQVSQDSTSYQIRHLTVVFTNKLGKTLSVTNTLYGNTCILVF